MWILKEKYAILFSRVKRYRRAKGNDWICRIPEREGEVEKMSLKKAYEQYFKMGTSVSRFDMKSDKAMEELVKHYSSMTAENDMKPMFMMDKEATLADPEKYHLQPVMKYDTARKYLEFAKKNGIALRGHTLGWHNQTPIWFFKENFEDDFEAPWASRETMLARLEWYIKSVLTFVQTEYPGVIYAWDVVNEAIEERDQEGWRKRSPWYQTLGEEFVINAFRFARKYAAPDVKLFYNDYNTFNPFKRETILNYIVKPLMEEKLIDGIGMQSHLILNEFDKDMSEYEKTLETFGTTGLEVQVTELDIHNADGTEEGDKKLAEAYKKLFAIYVNAKKNGTANLTCVTFWGMKDDVSWLTGFRKERSYPLLFGDNWEEKEAYRAVVKVAEEA